MRRWGLIALVLVAVAAEPASAADVTYDASGMTIKGTPGEASRLTVRFEPNVRATVHDDAGRLRPGFGCLGTTSDVSCGLLGPQCHPCSATIALGDGNEKLVLMGTSEKGPFLVDAGGGDDDIHIVGATNATVTGGRGRDHLRADTYSELDGGEGSDVLEGPVFASYASHGAGVTVTLDGMANDGSPGEADNVMTDSVIGSEAADVLIANDAANVLSGRGGNDVLAGGGGDDTLRGEGGTDRVDAGAGDDRVEGSRDDTVRCGSGSDVAAGLAVPGTYADCEAVFETSDDPYLTVSDVRISSRRPRVTIGWHAYPGGEGPPLSASGSIEMTYRGAVIGRGAFTGIARPDQRAVTLRLTTRGKRLACRSARRVRLLVIATSQSAPPLQLSSRSAIRRTARLPRVGTCARRR